MGTRITPCPYAGTGESSFYMDRRSSHGQKGMSLPYSGSIGSSTGSDGVFSPHVESARGVRMGGSGQVKPGWNLDVR